MTSRHRRGRRNRQEGNAGTRRGLIAGIIAAILIAGGGTAIGIAAATQDHAPQPTAAQAGTIGPVADPASAAGRGEATGISASAVTGWARSQPKRSQQLVLTRSTPTAIDIPAIDVHSSLLTLGLNSNGTIQVPPLFATPSKAAWYRRSVTPGQIGTSVIEGHIDTYKGPSVFFRLGAVQPGDKIDVTLADGTVAVFQVTGVRQYAKTSFPTLAFYGNTTYPSLHLVTCGGNFDYATRQYLSSTVVYASLVGAHPGHGSLSAGGRAPGQVMVTAHGQDLRGADRGSRSR